MVIKRYFSEEIFNKHIKNDFQFLINKIIKSGFEYDMQIRDNYFNLYYRGNSLGKVSYSIKNQKYRIIIHNKFINSKISDRFKPKEEGDYLVFMLNKEQLHPLFSSNNLSSMAQKVKNINYQEETTFEQMIMTDNVNREDLIIIDRQIMDTTIGTKMDLLALVQKENDNYQFCVIEIKLGNNPELKGEVVPQLNGYINRISEYFDDYKKCYEKNFTQKQNLGLINRNLKINIITGVIGVVVVLGYSGLAEENIERLKTQDPSVKILQLKNNLDLSKVF